MSILVTGGAGYIGSHTVLELVRAGHEVTVVDNLINSSAGSIEAVERLTGRTVPFHQIDLRDKAGLARLFDDAHFDAVIHFAGLKSVGDSVADPLSYYDNNVSGSIALFETMRKHGVFQIIFSSSATVYGEHETPCYSETTPTRPFNPYGSTKLQVEQVLQDMVAADKNWSAIALRYFNPVGADASGELGEDPLGVPNNLFPFVAQVATGARESLNVYGCDYETTDGTGLRDYIHVSDLASGHLAALRHLAAGNFDIFNLGVGYPVSVLDVIRTFQEETGVEIPYALAPRRPGDLPAYWADTSKARDQLGWTAERDLRTACADTWRWQTAHPRGFRSDPLLAH